MDILHIASFSHSVRMHNQKGQHSGLYGVCLFVYMPAIADPAMKPRPLAHPDAVLARSMGLQPHHRVEILNRLKKKLESFTTGI